MKRNSAESWATYLKILTMADPLVQRVCTEKHSGTIRQSHVLDEINVLPLKAGSVLSSRGARRVFDEATH